MKIAYVGLFDFSSSSANALRVKGMAEALLIAGHEVNICSSIPGESENRKRTLHKNLQLHSVDEYGNKRLAFLSPGLRGILLGELTLEWLKSLTPKPDIIVLYGTHLSYLWRLLRFSKKLKIPLVIDIVEWYSPMQLPGGVLGPYAFANELSMRFMASRANGVFAISRYLHTYFERKGCKTLRVPPLFASSKVRPKQLRSLHNSLNLCYVGTPGKKEEIESIFVGLQMAYQVGIKFSFHIVGITANELASYFSVKKLSIFDAKDVLRFYGRLENSKARQIIASCDFSVLLRKEYRFVKAGFPSKVAESLSLGTPVITNSISNLDDYLEDGENSIIVEEASAVSFSNAISRAARLNECNYASMKDSAYISADTHFSPENNSINIARFIEGIS